LGKAAAKAVASTLMMTAYVYIYEVYQMLTNKGSAHRAYQRWLSTIKIV
jgi:hypothetical protein